MAHVNFVAAFCSRHGHKPVVPSVCFTAACQEWFHHTSMVYFWPGYHRYLGWTTKWGSSPAPPWFLAQSPGGLYCAPRGAWPSDLEQVTWYPLQTLGPTRVWHQTPTNVSRCSQSLSGICLSSKQLLVFPLPTRLQTRSCRRRRGHTLLTTWIPSHTQGRSSGRGWKRDIFFTAYIRERSTSIYSFLKILVYAAIRTVCRWKGTEWGSGDVGIQLGVNVDIRGHIQLQNSLEEGSVYNTQFCCIPVCFRKETHSHVI